MLYSLVPNKRPPLLINYRIFLPRMVKFWCMVLYLHFIAGIASYIQRLISDPVSNLISFTFRDHLKTPPWLSRSPVYWALESNHYICSNSGSSPWFDCRRKFCILLLLKRFKWLSLNVFNKLQNTNSSARLLISWLCPPGKISPLIFKKHTLTDCIHEIHTLTDF